MICKKLKSTKGIFELQIIEEEMVETRIKHNRVVIAKLEDKRQRDVCSELTIHEDVNLSRGQQRDFEQR